MESERDIFRDYFAMSFAWLVNNPDKLKSFAIP